MIRTDIKNLEEIAPIIPDDVIEAYKIKYPRHDGETIKRPNITNGLTEIVVNKPNLPLSNGVGASANLTVSADILPKNVVKNHGVDIIEVDGLM